MKHKKSRPPQAQTEINQRPAVNNRLRERRQQLGIPQGELASKAGLTRQAIHAIEANRYLPSTHLALRFARVLKCSVEDLFRLADQEIIIDADLINVAQTPDLPMRVKVSRVGSRLLARPMTDLGETLSFAMSADGVIVESGRPRSVRKGGRVQVKLLNSPGAVDKGIFIAGCDPALFLAGEHVRKINAVAGVTNWTMGSVNAVRALRRNEVHMAGLHLVDVKSGQSNVPYLKRHVGGKEFVGIRFASWVQGILVGPENPKHIRSIEDIAKPGVRLVNREAGAGARFLLDTLMKNAGLAESQITGYRHEVASHLDVARLIRDGMVHAGIGVETAARHFGLGFIPLREEHYDLIMRVDFLHTHPGVSQFLDALVSQSFRREIEALGGYNLAEIGKLLRW